MKRLLLCAAAAAFVAAGTRVAPAANTSKAELSSRSFLVGNWNCSFTVGSRRGTYRSTWSYALDNLWLRQTIDQPALQKSMMSSSKGDPTAGGFRSEYLVGYDERHQGWVRFGAMTTGQYFAIRMRDVGDGGWAWKYVSFFPLKRPLTAADDATFAKRSDSRYTIDGPTYPGPGGQIVTEHHICDKASS